MDVLQIIGRKRPLFDKDYRDAGAELMSAIAGSRILLLGGAGSIGKELAALVFGLNPAALHIVDISENNLVELVRGIRSSAGYNDGETLFLPLDMGGLEFRAFLASQKPYDYVLNLAAMKHVRSEKDAYSLMRMIKVNVLDTRDTLEYAVAGGARKYFAVSTDKAKNPANLMGATKRIMESVLFGVEGATAISTARFANVAFSDGSLLHGFRQRLALRQPLSAPTDTKRYFVTGEEAGRLCLLSIVKGANREILFPKLDPNSGLQSFADIAVRFLAANGFEAFPVASEEEARGRAAELIATGKWPCHFFASDTSGEKPAEEFYSDDDDVDWSRYRDIGVIRVGALSEAENRRAADFLTAVGELRASGAWDRQTLVRLIADACPELGHVETGRSLDGKM